MRRTAVHAITGLDSREFCAPKPTIRAWITRQPSVANATGPLVVDALVLTKWAVIAR